MQLPVLFLICAFSDCVNTKGHRWNVAIRLRLLSQPRSLGTQAAGFRGHLGRLRISFELLELSEDRSMFVH